MTLPYILLSILWLALIAYASFGGADFGAGLLELFARGKAEERQRDLISSSIGPVWETNHVWLVFLVVGLFSAFPNAFAVLCIVLFYPLVLALIGVVLRGSSFIFRTHGLRSKHPALAIWNRVFAVSSFMTPFFLGISAAAVASGQIHTHNLQANPGSYLFTPFALTIGLLAVALCATLASIFLTVEATNRKEDDLVIAFRLRALIAGGITALLGLFGLLLAPAYAPILWQGMLNHAIALVIATMLIGLATSVTLYLGYYRIARTLIVAETAFMLGTWGVSQIPYIIPPNVTVAGAADSTSTLLLLLIGVIIGMVLLIPSLFLLFYIFKYQNTMGLLQQGDVPRADKGEGMPVLK